MSRTEVPKASAGSVRRLPFLLQFRREAEAAPLAEGGLLTRWLRGDRSAKRRAGCSRGPGRLGTETGLAGLRTK